LDGGPALEEARRRPPKIVVGLPASRVRMA